MNQFIIHPSDVAAYENISLKTAYKRIKVIKNSFNLDVRKPLTILHYAKYYQVDIKEMESYIFGTTNAKGQKKLVMKRDKAS